MKNQLSRPRMKCLAIALFGFVPVAAAAGTADPTGLSELVFQIVVYGPLVLLVAFGMTVGAAMGGFARGIRGALEGGGGGAIAGAIIYVIGYSVLRARSDDRLKEESVLRARHGEVVAACTAELSGVNEEYLVDSVVLKNGVFDGEKVTSLIVDQGLKFVELEAGPLPVVAEKGEARWGIRTEEGATFLVDRSLAYLRFSMGTEGDLQCDQRATKIFSMNRAVPLPADACIRIDHVAESFATHTIKLRQDSRSTYPHWALVEQATGNELLALATSDSNTNQTRENASGRPGVKQVRFGEVSCHDPYYSILNALYRSQEN
jgi:hypothetical protein